MNRKRVKTAILLFLIFLVVFFCKSCYNTLSNAEQEIYTSPNETNTIIVQYDILCRPTLYKKHGLEKRRSGIIQEADLWKPYISELNGYPKMKFD